MLRDWRSAAASWPVMSAAASRMASSSTSRGPLTSSDPTGGTKKKS